MRKYLLIILLSFASGVFAQQRAGEVTAEVTHTTVERTAGTAKSHLEAAKGTQIQWEDSLSTDAGGRARIVLDDSSILSLGSNSRLRVIKHDAAAQQTELELRMGRIRCQVTPLKGSSSSFKLHTPTAVVGVIGTDFGADASVPGETKFICISGTVRIFTPDESSYVDCAPGETVTVAKGAKPAAATAAESEQLERWKHITEPGDPAFVETVNPPQASGPLKPVRWRGLTLSGNGRLRLQGWNNFQNTTGNGTYGFVESFFRLGIGQTREHFQWQVELMQPSLLGMPKNAVVAAPQGQLGLGGSYFAANDSSRYAASVFPSKAYVRWTGWGGKPANQITVGRFEFIDGTETRPANPTLAFLKDQRIAHRLIGNFAFSLTQRSADGVSAAWNHGRANLTFVAARPTRGVFQVDGLGELDVAWQYGALTVATGKGKSSGDLRIFGLGYQDARAIAKTDNRAAATRNGTDRFSNINIGTVGLHYLHQLETSGGTFDWLLWGVAQFGQWGVQQHRAGAVVAETGWQPKGVAWKPWLRAGYTYGSGDGNPNDTRHNSFFQVLPTPRIYARFPFYNMENSSDASGMIIVRPTAKITARTDVHSLWLSSRRDLWYSGGGAFQPRTFGYTGRPSGGLRGLANVWDASVDYRASAHWGLGFYYGHAWGKGVMHSIYPKQPNGDFGYTELLYRF